MSYVNKKNLLVLSTTYTGVFDVPVAKLVEPPPSLRVREVEEWYVKMLEDMIASEHGDHEDLTAPLLAIVSLPSKNFLAFVHGMSTYIVTVVLHRLLNSMCFN